MGLDVLGFLKANKEDPEKGYASLLAWRLWDYGAVYMAITFPGKTPESTCSKGALGPSATVHLEQNPNVFPGPLWPEPMLTMK